MTVMDISEPFAYGGHLYVRAPRPVRFRSDVPLEEAVPETRRHLENRTLLFLLLKDAFASGATIGSDQFVYSDPEDPRKCVSPDAFVKLGRPDTMFDVWKVWEDGALDIAVEIVSDHDRSEKKWEKKLAHYRSNGVRELLRFDSDHKTRPIRVWDRVDGDLVERSPKDPKLCECAALTLWWTIAPSIYGPMLRLSRDPAGRDLLPTPSEDRVRLAEELAEERKARSQAEHERMLAEHARAAEKDARLAAERRAEEQAEARQREAEARQREAEARQREAEARQREVEAREKAERERDAAVAELARLRATAEKPRKPRR